MMNKSGNLRTQPTCMVFCKKKNTELAEKNHHNKREEEVATHRRVDLDQMQHR